MKILLITEYFPSSTKGDFTGGVETRNYYIARYLAKRHSVVVLASLEKGKPSCQQIEGILVIRTGTQRSYTRLGGVIGRFFFMVSSLWVGIRIDFDLVEGSGFFGYIPAYILSVLKRKKRVAFVPDLAIAYAFGIQFIVRKVLICIERFIFSRKWHGIICISRDVEKKIEKISSSRVYMIPCGVDLDLIKNEKKAFVSGQKLCVISRLVPYKRVEDIIFAMVHLERKLPSLRCTIVGVGEQLEYLKKIVKKNRISHAIQFSGYIRDYRSVIKILKSSTIFCSASLVEGFGIAVMEAMGSGVPVLLSDIPVHREITQGKAQYFRPEDVPHLCLKVTKILNNFTLQKKLKKSGLSIAKEHDWSTIGKKTEGVYDYICHHRSLVP